MFFFWRLHCERMVQLARGIRIQDAAKTQDPAKQALCCAECRHQGSATSKLLQQPFFSPMWRVEVNQRFKAMQSETWTAWDGRTDSAPFWMRSLPCPKAGCLKADHSGAVSLPRPLNQWSYCPSRLPPSPMLMYTVPTHAVCVQNARQHPTTTTPPPQAALGRKNEAQGDGRVLTGGVGGLVFSGAAY